jgi:hypothetical protein
MASMQESRLVVATTDDGIVDYGVLQRGYEYRVSVPLTLRGAKAAPTRYRVHVEQSSSLASGQAAKTVPVGTAGADSPATPNFLVRVMSGGVGRLMAGLPCPLELVVEGYRPGVVDALVVVVSEGGESRFRVRGHVLDGGTYRAFAKTQLQLSHQQLARKGVTKLGQTTSDKHRPILEAVSVASDNAASTVFSQLAEPSVGSDQHDGALPACPEADAVERLLSAEVFTLFFFVSCISFPSSALSQFGVRTDLNSLEHSFHHSFLFFESLCSPFLGSIRRLKSLRPSQC